MSLYFRQILLFLLHSSCLSNRGNRFCLVPVSSVWLYARFHRFFSPEAGELPTQQLSLFVETSAHLACHFQWVFIPSVVWKMTSLKRKAFWQLPLRIDGERVSVTLCAGPHMYDLMHSPPQRETVGHRWCHRHWCLPAWPHNVSSGASATYFGGHAILESTVSYFPLLSRRFRSYTDAFFGVICQKDTVCVFTLKWAEQDFGEKVKILWCFLL